MTEECSIVAAEELKRMPMVTTMIRNPGRPCCFNETRTTALPLAKMATGTARFTKKFSVSGSSTIPAECTAYDGRSKVINKDISTKLFNRMIY
jgi:hypothetical protein